MQRPNGMRALPYPASLVEAAFRWACITELQALKPGNVHRYADGHGMSLAQFERSAEVAAPALAVPHASVGERVLRAVRATRQAVGCNTNLGILLLCAPLAAAAQRVRDEPDQDEPAERLLGLSVNLQRVLIELDIADAQATFQAIIIAIPGGLGQAPRHDVRAPALISLLEAMREAAPRDRIAQQYVSNFSDVFEFGLPALASALQRWKDLNWATTAVYLKFLAAFPDSHLTRKYGNAPGCVAHSVTLRARTALAQFELCQAPEHFAAALLEWDHELKSAAVNPGTSADLTVATLFVHALSKAVAVETHGM